MLIRLGLIVLAYTFLGGLTSAIYNEVLQFFLIVSGFLPLVVLGLRNVGGWSGLQAKLATEAVSRGLGPGAYTHAWAHLGNAAKNPLGVEWFGLVMGLGFVLSFGYWCTDFLVVQRAMAADSMAAARRTPLIAAVPKMFFPFLVILPGLLALAATAGGHGLIPAKLDAITGQALIGTDGRPVLDYDLATPMMLLHYFPTGCSDSGSPRCWRSFMSGMAGNVTAFNTVWTYDIYQATSIAAPATGTISGWGGSRPSSASSPRWRRPTWRRRSTTSWTCSSWSSRSSTRRCSPPSCSACSGSGRPATARSPA